MKTKDKSIKTKVKMSVECREEAWLYLNSIAILIGFELNVRIMAAPEKETAAIQAANCNADTV
jgi:hypothetical protein